MKPSTLPGNIALYDNATGLVQGGLPTIIYLPLSNEMIVIPTSILSGPSLTFDGTYIIGGAPGIESTSGQFIQALTALDGFTVSADTASNVNGPSFSGVTAAMGTTANTIDLTFALALEQVSPPVSPTPAMTGNYIVYMATSQGGEDLLTAPVITVASGTAAFGQPPGQGLITIGSLNPSLTYYFMVVASDGNGNVAIAAETTGAQPHP